MFLDALGRVGRARFWCAVVQSDLDLLTVNDEV